MDESVFSNWWWLLILGCLLIWWWPKKVKANYFTTKATIGIDSLMVDFQSTTESKLPKLELISSNWGIITSESTVQIYKLNEAGEFIELSGCHAKSDLYKILPASNQNCLIPENEPIAIPYSSQIYVKHDSKHLPIKPVAKLPKHSELLLTEVMWMGSFNGEESQASDEWFELFNNTDKTLDLGGIQMVGAGINGQTLTIPAELLLPPFTFFIVGRNGVDNSQLSKNPDLILQNLSLSNSDSNLKLVSIGGELLDQLPGGNWKVGVNDTSKKQRASAQRTFFATAGSDWSSWAHCDVKTCPQLDLSFWKSQETHQNFGTPWQPSVF